MDYEIIKALGDVSAVLKDRGFEKQAESIDAATFDMPRGVDKWSPSMMQPAPVRTELQEVAPTGQHQFAQKGELVTELDPQTGEEKVILWGIKSPMTMDELEDAVKKGYLAVNYFNEQHQNAKDPQAKKFFKTILDKAVAYSRVKAAAKLASLGSILNAQGYEALGRRLLEASDNLSVEVRHLVEKHEIPSLESLYENSDKPQAFEQKIQKLASIYENVGKLIMEFDNKYVKDILNPLTKKEITEEDAVKKTIKMVRETDSNVDTKLKEILKSIS